VQNSKACTYCQENKPLDQFYNRKGSKDGKQTRCRSCQSILTKANYRKHNTKIKRVVYENRDRRIKVVQDYVYDYLEKHPCVDCGDTRVLGLDFDHLHSKRFNVSEGIKQRLSLQTIQDEISKCVVRCRICHASKTHQEQNTWRYKTYLARQGVTNG